MVYFNSDGTCGTKRKVGYMMQGSLAEQLRVLRARMGLSLTEAASRAGVTRDTLSDLEHGKRQPYMPTLAKIAAGYDVPVEELLEEPALAGEAEAPQETGQAQTSAQTVEEFERTLAHVLEPARAEALREAQAASRAIASEGIPQLSLGDIPEAEVAKRFVEEFSPEERPMAFGEIAVGYTRLERANANLEANYTNARELLRERDEKNGQLQERLKQEKEAYVRLTQENARLRQDIAELRSEAGREGAHR